jgi:hypothetical protein
MVRRYVSTAVIAIRELSILGSVVGNTSDLAELVDIVKHAGSSCPTSSAARSRRSMRVSRIFAPGGPLDVLF